MVQKRTLEKMFGALDGVDIISNKEIEVRVFRFDPSQNDYVQDPGSTQAMVDTILNQMRLKGEIWGGFKCGHGGWVLQRSSGTVEMGDWNDKSSRWHY